MTTNEKKVALVTGASRGIGKAIAIELGKLGFTVVGTATTPKGAESISDYFKQENIDGKGMVLNVTDDESISKTMTNIAEDYSAPLILVNNAAITQDNLLLRMSDEQWHDVIDTNLNSIFRVSKACLKPMVKARWGRIVNIASVVGVTGNPGQVNYAAAKAGILGFSKSLAQEIAPRGITVNIVAPGFIDTDMTKALNEKQRDAINAQIPMRRMGQPEEIARAVGFLVSDKAGYITGQTLHINGGMVMV